MLKKPVRPTVEERVINISGIVQTAERRLPLRNLIVSVYSIDLVPLHGENHNWFQYLKEGHAVKKVGDDVTTEGGSFSVTFDRQWTLGDLSAIGLVVLPPDEGANSSPTPLYVSPTPRVVDRSQTFVIQIPTITLETAGISQEPVRAVGEVLEEAQTPNKEIADWLTKNKKERIESLRKIKQEAMKAFENFNASILPKSVQKRDNYIEKRGDLEETLKKVRGKTIKSLKAKKVVKKRQLKLPHELYKALALEPKKKVQLPRSKFDEILGNTRPPPKVAIEKRLENANQRKKQQNAIVEQLYSCIKDRDK